ncbi:phosphatases II [Neolentinus lepideus HHB14362 ss-1]|uniref:protein-tyrosine-phosphatase n=1 Tax=Neolentinus lepideus HHB14362 ss-1 TaxID=1314782 RepID=A0A165SJS8_9AGAM|nr:phosphatases II [Neolentinus lepideus HHB14362 ss-1]
MLSFSSGSFQSDLITSAGVQQTVVKGTARVATLVLPRLYLSDIFTARDEKELKMLGITHVLSVMETAPSWSEDVEAALVEHMHVKIADRPDADILQWLDGTTEFIKNALESNKKNKVLVHCFQGISRSATVVCAYLIATLGMSHTKSISFVKGKRGIVSPNAGFVKQLQIYATRFEGVHQSEGVATKVSRIVRKIRGKTATEETHISSVTVQNGEFTVTEVDETVTMEQTTSIAGKEPQTLLAASVTVSS